MMSVFVKGVIFLIALFQSLFLVAQTKKIPPVNVDTVKVIIHDTIYIETPRDSLLIAKDYYSLYEKLLDQKQAHYDSTLTTLSWWAGAVGTALTIAIFIFVLFGIQEFRAMKKEMRDELKSKTIEITNSIEKKLSEESKKVANDLITKKYEQDISDIKEKVNNLETFSRDISESYVLRYEKDKPELKELDEEKKKSNNPFDIKP